MPHQCTPNVWNPLATLVINNPGQIKKQQINKSNLISFPEFANCKAAKLVETPTLNLEPPKI